MELRRRSLDTDVRKKEADVDKANAETREANAEAQLAEINAAEAQYDLMKKFESAGLVLHRAAHGNPTVLPANASKFLPPRGRRKRDEEPSKGHSA